MLFSKAACLTHTASVNVLKCFSTLATFSISILLLLVSTRSFVFRSSSTFILLFLCIYANPKYYCPPKRPFYLSVVCLRITHTHTSAPELLFWKQQIKSKKKTTDFANTRASHVWFAGIAAERRKKSEINRNRCVATREKTPNTLGRCGNRRNRAHACDRIGQLLLRIKDH